MQQVGVKRRNASKRGRHVLGNGCARFVAKVIAVTLGTWTQVYCTRVSKHVQAAV